MDQFRTAFREVCEDERAGTRKLPARTDFKHISRTSLRQTKSARQDRSEYSQETLSGTFTTTGCLCAWLGSRAKVPRILIA